MSQKRPFSVILEVRAASKRLVKDFFVIMVTINDLLWNYMALKSVKQLSSFII